MIVILFCYSSVLLFVFQDLLFCPEFTVPSGRKTGPVSQLLLFFIKKTPREQHILQKDIFR